jgi:nitrate/nitrite transport system permease protein
MREKIKALAGPASTIVIFIGLWAMIAPQIKTSLGQVPGPVQVWEQVQSLTTEYRVEVVNRRSFIAKEKERASQKRAENPAQEVKTRKYSGRPTFPGQIWTSLLTVFTGFMIASLIAIPLGVLCGLNRPLMAALNPLIQIFKPVSPVAWLPIVTMVVSAVYTVPQPWLEKAFIISAITVSLCSIWPSLINTAIGVASIDKDYINVARVLRLKLSTKIFRIVMPASLPYIFTGLRISLGVGWMVLIAAELLAQNPGLGKFVWDEFQNGSSQSLARIMVAVFTIGGIGFILDRTMVTLNKLVSFGQNVNS